MRSFRRRQFLALASALPVAAATGAATAADRPSEIVIDWATYNPVSLLLKDRGWVEEALGKDGINVRWVQSAGSNKALEFLNAGSIQFGSTAGAAALLGRINGNPIRSVYAYSQPEWTALVTRPDSGITKVEDLKGRRVAATKGTDPYIFLLRALDKHGLAVSDIQLVLLQHDQGRVALERGDVDAWAGLDPMMAATELEMGNKLFYRDFSANTWGILNVPESFAEAHPDIVQNVIGLYERGRALALQEPAVVTKLLAKAARLPETVAARQLERTKLDNPRIGEAQHSSIAAAGKALQVAGVIKPEVDIEAMTAALLDRRFTLTLASR